MMMIIAVCICCAWAIYKLTVSPTWEGNTTVRQIPKERKECLYRTNTGTETEYLKTREVLNEKFENYDNIN